MKIAALKVLYASVALSLWIGLVYLLNTYVIQESVMISEYWKGFVAALIISYVVRLTDKIYNN